MVQPTQKPSNISNRKRFQIENTSVANTRHKVDTVVSYTKLCRRLCRPISTNVKTSEPKIALERESTSYCPSQAALQFGGSGHIAEPGIHHCAVGWVRRVAVCCIEADGGLPKASVVSQASKLTGEDVRDAVVWQLD